MKKFEASGEPNGYPSYARAAACGMLNGCFMLLFQGEAAFQEYILKLIDATQQQVSLNMRKEKGQCRAPHNIGRYQPRAQNVQYYASFLYIQSRTLLVCIERETILQ